MSFCKPASEINNYRFQWIPAQLAKIYGDLSVEEFVLVVRNGSIDSLLYDDEYAEADKAALDFMIGDVREHLVVNGFIRPEMMGLNNPELYFVKTYLKDLKIAEKYYSTIVFEGDFEENFMPYFYSNDEYENYVFWYERIEAVINVLANFLDEDELYEVALDVMYMGDWVCDSGILEKAKKKLVIGAEKLVPLLEQAFAYY